MLDSIINENKKEFTFDIREMLDTKVQAYLKTQMETLEESAPKVDVSYFTNMFTLIGLEDIEFEGNELSATTNSLHMLKLATGQLDTTNVNYTVDIISSEIEVDDDFEGSYVDHGEVDMETYLLDKHDDDIYVISVDLSNAGLDESTDLQEGNPLKRSTQFGIVAGKRVRKLVKSDVKGFRKSKDGKVKKQTSSEKINRLRGSRKAKLKSKGKMASRVRKFKKSQKKSAKIKNRSKRRS